jgi:hypothetical protein
MADGGYPPGLMDQTYPGGGHYVDVETLYFNYQASFSESSIDVEFSETILDMADLLDRREEMADLLHSTTTLMIMEKGDNSLPSNPQQAIATSVIHTNSPGNGPLETQQVDFQLEGTDADFIDTTQSADALGKLLAAGTYGAYEDASNAAGGSGGGQAIDREEIYGWQLSDPSFAERDEISLDIEYESSGDTAQVVTISGRLTFGLYELEEPDVKPC